MDLFSQNNASSSDLSSRPTPTNIASKSTAFAPLAEEMRPQHFDEIVGQDHLLDENSVIKSIIKSDFLPSLILWGPPGCGKTTLAKILCQSKNYATQQLSATMAGVADLKRTFEEALTWRKANKKTVLFIDEIHRFNKTQQDALLPHLESGLITLIGATTENPSFALNPALLSRARVVVLEKLSDSALETLMKKCEAKKGPLNITLDAKRFLIDLARGDARYLFNLIEQIHALASKSAMMDVEDLQKILQKRALIYDKQGEEHYNLICTLHKAVRGSDVDAALYWLARMLKSGEDPLFIARRLIRMSVEDIGLADPQALSQALSALQNYQTLGSPEGELALFQCTAYLAAAPKSNSIYLAAKKALTLVEETGHLAPPRFSLNAPTKLMKEQGYGEGYIYDHNTDDGYAGQNYFPENLSRQDILSLNSRDKIAKKQR